MASRHNLAGAYQKADRLDEAIPLFERRADHPILALVPIAESHAGRFTVSEIERF
jgi:hypothetical protein